MQQTDRQAVGCKDGRPDGRAEERTNCHTEREIYKKTKRQKVWVWVIRDHMLFI